MAKAAIRPQPKTFESVLDMPASEIERPKPLPVGSYVCVVQGQPRIDKSAKKQTEFSEFTLKILEALDDVDSDAIEALGGVQGKILKVTFYHTENSIYRLKEFLQHLGIDMDEGESLRQAMAEAAGKQVTAYVVHEASQDGETVYAKVKNTAPVE